MQQPLELEPDISQLVTEDDEPVDNLASEKQQRLLVEPLYTSWTDRAGSVFLAAANVGLFDAVSRPPLVPDMFLSLDVAVPDNWWEKRKRSYLFWEFGKPPEVVVEIVSNLVGKEITTKLLDYARMRVHYYVVFDPIRQLGGPVLSLYELRPGGYVERQERWLEGVGLGLTLWDGSYEGKAETWLRWSDATGTVLATGAEAKERERARANEAEERASEAEARAIDAEERAGRAEERAERLARRLRELGIEPNGT